MIINEDLLINDLRKNVAVLAEPIQTILRKNGYSNAYEMLKEITRGKEVTFETITEFIKSLEITDNDKNELLKLKPENYIGLASKLVNFI